MRFETSASGFGGWIIPDWKRGLGWERAVASTCVDAGGERILLDSLAPPEDAREIWERLDERPPSVVVALKPDHVRDTDLFVRRYGARGRAAGMGDAVARGTDAAGAAEAARVAVRTCNRVPR